MTEIKIKNWDGKEFTLDELKELCDDHMENDASYLDADLATTPAIIEALIEKIEELQKQAKNDNGVIQVILNSKE